jgi:hypothetical protein
VRVEACAAIWRGLLERAAVFEVGRDPPTAEGVVADFGGNAGRLCSPAHHRPRIGPMQPLDLPHGHRGEP